MRSFGISAGIAGLARLLQVLFPAQAWLFATVAALAAVALVANLLFVLQDGFAAYETYFGIMKASVTARRAQSPVGETA